jgi:serine/threonine-protein kinase HipA
MFTLERRVGTFEYDDAYRELPGATSIDPMTLPLTRSRRPVKETRQGGLFGVIRDASPEGFGLAMLERMTQRTLDDPMQRLELSEGDAVGALEVCDDIEAKQRFDAPESSDLFDALAQLPPERPSSQAAREIREMHGTSLGGERPKLTVRHEGQWWIAKLQDRGDAPHAPLREYAAMSVARAVGLDACDVQFHLVGEREVLLVRRFDREVDAQGLVQRKLFASAHTMLRLDAQTRGERVRSYLALARELQRWCGDREVDPKPMQRELWKRMVYNAVCGNGDDHPRNHGVIRHAGHWRLSPAFDIAPHVVYSGVQSLAITRDGSLTATGANLLQDCESFSMQRDEAVAFIDQARDVYLTQWPQAVRACGYAIEELPPVDPAQWLDRT